MLLHFMLFCSTVVPPVFGIPLECSRDFNKHDWNALSYEGHKVLGICFTFLADKLDDAALRIVNDNWNSNQMFVDNWRVDSKEIASTASVGNAGMGMISGGRTSDC